MTNGQKMRKLFEEKKLVVAPGCHDALTAKIISYLGFDAVYMTGYGQSASHLGQPDVGLMTMSEMVMRASNTVEAAGNALVVADADTGFGNAVNVQRTIRLNSYAGQIGNPFGEQIGRASVGKECRSRWSPYH